MRTRVAPLETNYRHSLLCKHKTVPVLGFAASIAHIAQKKDLLSQILTHEATTGFEPVIKVLQTFALPLGHVAKIAPPVGLEPTTPRLTAACSTD